MMFYKSHVIVGHNYYIIRVYNAIIIQTIIQHTSNHILDYLKYVLDHMSVLSCILKYMQVIIYKLLPVLIDFKSCDLYTKPASDNIIYQNRVRDKVKTLVHEE